MKFGTASALVIALALSACGGGGSSGGGTGGGGTTPTPSPTPTATPTPTPTPVAYTKYADLTGNQTFKTACAGSEDAATFSIPFGQGTTIASDRSIPDYRISSDGSGLSGPFSVTFNQSNRDPAAPATVEAYVKANANNFNERFVIGNISVGTTALEYVRSGQIIVQSPTRRLVNMFCAFGVPTLTSDRPATSVAYVNSRFVGSLRVVQNVGAGPVTTYSISASTARLNANPANGQITVTINLIGREIVGGVASATETPLGTFTGTTSIDGTVQSFSGLVLDSNNTVAGTFGGWFFGPQGREAAFTFNIQQRRNDNSDVIATSSVFLLQ